MTIDDVFLGPDNVGADVDSFAIVYASCHNNDGIDAYDCVDEDFCDCPQFRLDNLEVLRRKYEEKKRDGR